MGSVVHHEELGKIFLEFLKFNSSKGRAFKPATPFEKLLSATMLIEGVT